MRRSAHESPQVGASGVRSAAWLLVLGGAVLGLFPGSPEPLGQSALVNPRFQRVAIVTEKGGQDFAIDKVSPAVFTAPARGAAQLDLDFRTTVADRKVVYSVTIFSVREPGATKEDSSGRPTEPPIMSRFPSTVHGECGIYRNPGAYRCTIRVPADKFDSSHQWEYVTVQVSSLASSKDISRNVPGLHNYDTVQNFRLKFARVEHTQRLARAPQGNASHAAPASKHVEMGNRMGSDYAQRQTVSARECGESCARDGRCKAWTWVRQGTPEWRADGNCWLKSSVPPLLANNCCFSGIK